MAVGTLYTYPDNFRAFKALIAAQYSETRINVLSESPGFIFGETNKTNEFLTKFPFGKVPAFESSEGVLLWSSNAIAYYVANHELRGKTSEDAAFVQQWLEFGDLELLPAALTWVFPCMGIMQYNKQNTERAKEDVKLALGVLNKHLELRTYLVGERISLADICVACNLLLLYKMVLDPEFRRPFQNVNRWFTTLIHQPQFEAVIGKEFTLCEAMAQFDAKKFGELQGHKIGKKEKQKPPQQQVQKQDKKQTSAKNAEVMQSKKSKPAEPAANDDEEEEDDELGEKPSKDPFMHLPKGTFNMEDWKRMYSNNDTKTVALPWFWQHFDNENYSLWFCEYKYPEELKLIFMTCNLVAGMFQRLDKMRKHAFGSMIVFGENNSNSISGLWMWRGQELAFTLSEDLQIDYESYTWTKLDAQSERTKQLVDEYLSWEGDFDGKRFNQGKIFK